MEHHHQAWVSSGDDQPVPGPGRNLDKRPVRGWHPGDFTQPTGLLFVGCLHHIADSDDPGGVVARYLAALAPGSYLVISHATDERSPEKMRANSEVAESSGAVLIPRGRDAILRMFNGRELIDPGLVLVSYWRPDGADPGPNADRAWAYGGVAVV